MSAARSVEKRLSLELLDEGEIRLSDRDASQLDLPAHAVDVTCDVGGEGVVVEWRPVDRVLRGEALAERLQLHGEAGAVLRLVRDGDRLALQFLPIGTTTITHTGTAPAVRSPTAAVRPARRTKRQLREERYRLRDRTEYEWSGAVGFHKESFETFIRNIENGGWDSEELFSLRVRGERLAAVSGFDELLAVDLAKVEHMPHQEAAALKVLRHMRGRAILADEVGLGKTIEAGLVMKELIVRGLAQRVLVLCPASLRDQWRDELREKFDEPFEIVTTGGPIRGDRIIMSVDLARRENNARTVTRRPWDLVVLDEAHKGINGPATRRLIGALDTRYLLFLTATPVQNRLTELYNLVELLRPGTFASQRAFMNRFVDRDDPRRPLDARGLRKLVADVMVRTTREQVGIDRVARYAVDKPVRLTRPERQIYDLCTQGLRSIMTGPGDALRRRSLAHRLTASPRSLAITARKIAENHADPLVKDFLTELSDLAIGFGLTSRQKRLLEVLADWTAEKQDKGQVLVFTQHADTLDDLLRIVSSEGLDAVAFHGGMSASARRSAIDNFRNGVPLMIATDAGAEGLNLQFANCVVNYDLPWNPMRIEQRIGRVHRLTQLRDVHVANFFARDTIDEQVYHLLHDKLRMFELLFGQITTILGELEVGGDSQTFEGQVLSAFLAEDDVAMQRRLDDLGRRVDVAYSDAQKMVREGSVLNGWIVDRSHRAEIVGRRADELQPQARLAGRERQREVTEFVIDYLRLTGAEISEQDLEGGFLSARLSPELATHFDGRDELHLAFTPAALDRHRDAELCAAGSEVFEEMLLSLRELGDLHASLPEQPDVPQVAWLAHDESLTLISREVLGPDDWSATVAWRTHCDADEADDAVFEVVIGDPDEARTSAHRTLASGSKLPTTFGPTADIIDTVAELTRPLLEEMADAAQERTAEHVASERDRVLAGIEEQLPELQRESRGSSPQAARARVDLHRLNKLHAHYAAMKSPTAEVRADLLALQLVGSSSLTVREVWRGANGVEAELHTSWDPRAPVDEVAYCDEQARPIARLVVCREGHPVDELYTRTCPRCDELACDLCSARGRFARCELCGVEQCRACITRAGICETCSAPERMPDADVDGQRAWSLGFAATLLLTSTTAVVRRADGTTCVRTTGGPDAPARKRVRAAAAAFGARWDMGAKLLGLRNEGHVPAGAIPLLEERSTLWEFDPAGGPDVDAAVAAMLPDCEPMVPAQPEARLAPLLARLRRIDPPEMGPSLVARDVRRSVYLEGRGDGLWEVDRTERGGLEPTVVERRLKFQRIDGSSGLIAAAQGHACRVVVERVHRSFVLNVEDRDGDGNPYFLPGLPGVSEESERTAMRLLAEQANADVAVLDMSSPTPLPTTFARPQRAVLVERVVKPVWLPTPGHGTRPFDADALETIGHDGVGPSGTVELDRGLFGGVAADLASLGPVGPVYRLERFAEVREDWRDAGSVTLSRLVDPHDAVYPVLDDTGRAARDFRVDSIGHLCEPDHVWECLACDRLRCRACRDDGALAPCRACGQDACGSCRSTRTRSSCPDEHCELCDARSCLECGRTLDATSCILCGRQACRRCRADGIDGVCRGCMSMARISPDQVAALPPVLAARGLAVYAHTAGETTSAIILGATRREFAVVTSGVLDRWWTLDPIDRDDRMVLVAVGSDRGIVADGCIEHVELKPTDMQDHEAIVVHECVVRWVEWEVHRAGACIARSQARLPLPPAQPDADAILSALGDARPRLPDAAPESARCALEAIVPGTPGPAGVSITVRTIEERVRTELDGDGLRVRTADWSGERASLSPWRHVEDDAYSRSCSLEPDVLLNARAGDCAAWLVRFGSGAVVAYRAADTAAELRIDDDADFPEAAVLCDQMHIERSRLVVTRAVDCRSVCGISVGGATLTDRCESPAWVDEPDSEPRVSAAAAADEWIRAEEVARLRSIPRSDAPSTLRAALAAAVGLHDVPVRRGAVAARFRDTWRAGDVIREIEYVVLPDREPAIVSDDTGEPVHAVHLDRSGHLAAKPSSCVYCATTTCSACEDGARPCVLCGITVCGRCRNNTRHDAWLCPACASLRHLGRLQTLVTRGVRGHALRGEDALHRVTFVSSREGQYAVVSPTTRNPETSQARALEPFPATPRQAALLNELAGASWFSATARV